MDQVARRGRQRLQMQLHWTLDSSAIRHLRAAPAHSLAVKGRRYVDAHAFADAILEDLQRLFRPVLPEIGLKHEAIRPHLGIDRAVFAAEFEHEFVDRDQVGLGRTVPAEGVDVIFAHLMRLPQLMQAVQMSLRSRSRRCNMNAAGSTAGWNSYLFVYFLCTFTPSLSNVLIPF